MQDLIKKNKLADNIFKTDSVYLKDENITEEWTNVGKYLQLFALEDNTGCLPSKQYYAHTAAFTLLNRLQF